MCQMPRLFVSQLMSSKFADRVAGLVIDYLWTEYCLPTFNDDTEAREIVDCFKAAFNGHGGSEAEENPMHRRPLSITFINSFAVLDSNGDDIAISQAEVTVRSKHLLGLLASAQNTNSAKLCDVIKQICTILLGKPALAPQALQVLVRIVGRRLQSYQIVLERLLDDQTLRDGMNQFDVSVTSTTGNEHATANTTERDADNGDVPKRIANDDRTLIVPVLIRIMLGKMIHRRRHRDDVAAFRQRCARYLNQLTVVELQLLVTLILRGFAPHGALPSETGAAFDSHVQALERVSHRRCVGLLQLIRAITPHMPKSLNVYLDDFLPVVVALQKRAAGDKKLRGEALRTFVTLFSVLPSNTAYCRWMPFALDPLQPLLEAMAGSIVNNGNASQLLLLLEVMTRYSSSLVYLSLPAGLDGNGERGSKTDDSAALSLMKRLQLVVECLAHDIDREKSADQLASELMSKRTAKASVTTQEPILSAILQLLENIINLTRPAAKSLAEEYGESSTSVDDESHLHEADVVPSTLGIRFKTFEPLPPHLRDDNLESRGRVLAQALLQLAAAPFLKIFHRRFVALQEQSNQSITRTPLATRQLHVIAELSKYISNVPGQTSVVKPKRGRRRKDHGTLTQSSSLGQVAMDLADMFLPFLEDTAKRMFHSKCAILRILVRTLPLSKVQPAPPPL